MGLKALVHSLKYYIKDFGELNKAIIANEEFANVTEEEVNRYF